MLDHDWTANVLYQSKADRDRERQEEILSQAKIADSLNRSLGIISSIAQRHDILLTRYEESQNRAVDTQKLRRVIYILKKAYEKSIEALESDDQTGGSDG